MPLLKWREKRIHPLIAICFLAPKYSFLGKLRNLSLLIFCVTIYPLVPIPGFASALLLMGYIQSSTDKENKLFISTLKHKLFPYPKDSSHKAEITKVEVIKEVFNE